MNRLEAMRARRAAASAEPPPPHPPGADRRPLEGFPAWYAIDCDKVVWTCRGKGGGRCPWHPLSVFKRGRRSTRLCVQLTAFDGRQVFRSVASLYRSAFPPPKLTRPRTALRTMQRFDDDGDIEADASLTATPFPRVSPARSALPPVAPLPPHRSQPARLDDVGDPHFDPLEIPGPIDPEFLPAIAVPLPRLGPMARGSAHPKAKLTEDLVIEMRRLRREGWTTPALAARYGVGRNTVCYALTGVTWKHVPGPISKR